MVYVVLKSMNPMHRGYANEAISEVSLTSMQKGEQKQKGGVIKLIILHNSEVKILEQPELNPQKVVVITKEKGERYVYDGVAQSVFEPELGDNYGCIATYRKINDPNATLEFIFLNVKEIHENAWLTSHYIENGMITSRLVQQYRKKVGLPPLITPEKVIFNELEPYMHEYFKNYKVEKTKGILDIMRLKLSDPRTRKVYTDYCGEFKNKPYLDPDYFAWKIDKKGKVKYEFIEIECDNHREIDFKKKLMKIHMLGKTTYFLLNDRTRHWHTEIMCKFERESGRKLTNVYYATFSQFKVMGMDAFIKYR